MEQFEISVIMGIYNCEDTLIESLDSLFNQSFQNFNLIMCDDGSDDRTYEIALKYKEKFPDRIILLKHATNMGLNITLNDCLSKAKGRYIARMDGDDISLRNRFEKEYSFLEKNHEYTFVSCQMILFDENGDWGKTNYIPAPKAVDLVKSSTFAHAGVLVRREAYEKVNGYSVSDKLLRVEDYHLWIKFYAEGFVGYNIMEPLYKMRDDRNAVHRRTLQNRINEARVKKIAISEFKLSKLNYIYILRPIILALIPRNLYSWLHRLRNK